MCVRTSRTFYGPFILSMGRSPGFGPVACDMRPLQTCFRFGYGALHLLPPHTAARRTVLQKVRGRASSCCASAGREHRVSGSLSLPSRGPFHLSLTVLYAIGHWVVFSLGGWSPRLPTRFPVSYGTLDTARPLRLPVRGFHTYCRLSQNRSSWLGFLNAVRNPGMHAFRFRLFRVRSPLLAESLLFSLPLPT